MNDSELYERARKRVEELRGFYIHLLVYVVVNLGLLAINLLTDPDSLWFYFPLAGWGLGLLAHGLSVGRIGFLGKSWEERKIRELMEREGRSKAGA